MPKMKSKRGSAKRFKISGTGKVIRHKAGSSHILTSKSPKRKRGLRKASVIKTRKATEIKALVKG